jgi:arginase
MGNGPAALIAHGLVDRLKSQSNDVELLEVNLPDGFYSEAQALVQLQHAAAVAAREAIARGSRSIFLSGNCGTAALSATAALGSDQTGIVWFDAHGDCNTPATSPSGFLDGMCLGILTGQCWPQLVKRFDSFVAIPGDQIIQIGVRHVDPEEEVLLQSLKITRISAGQIDRLAAQLAGLTKRTGRLYVHLDADVLDIGEGAANSYACAGGLTRQQLSWCLRAIAATGRIAVAGITSYDPAGDAHGRIAEILCEAATILAT